MNQQNQHDQKNPNQKEETSGKAAPQSANIQNGFPYDESQRQRNMMAEGNAQAIRGMGPTPGGSFHSQMSFINSMMAQSQGNAK